MTERNRQETESALQEAISLADPETKESIAKFRDLLIDTGLIEYVQFEQREIEAAATSYTSSHTHWKMHEWDPHEQLILATYHQKD